MMLMLAKLMESAKALKMLPYSHIHATRSLCRAVGAAARPSEDREVHFTFDGSLP
jgi:hypothetical protein